MTDSKSVRISAETMDMLKKYAKPFESPDDCMKRVLAAHPCSVGDSMEDESESE